MYSSKRAATGTRRGCSPPRAAVTARRFGELGLARVVRIDSGVEPQRSRIAQAFRGPEPSIGGEQGADQRLDFPHQSRIVETQTVPLDEGELRVVPAAAFAVAEHFADLV